jgi:ABC-type multidrug transport system ATPase subunit
MRMLTAQTRADEGSIRVLGHQPREVQAREPMGVVPQQTTSTSSSTPNLAARAVYRVPAGNALSRSSALWSLPS